MIARKLAQHRGRRGNTAVEVLSAMTLLAIGASGVIGMQRVTLQGSDNARRFDIGGNIANEWCSRLQRDTAQWTQPNASVLDVSNIGNTRFLQFVTTCAAGFCDPPPVGTATAPGMSGSFDTFGRDIASANADATYCAQYRLQWIAPPGVAAPFNPSALMRAAVRVFWSRLDRNPIGNCATATPDAANANQL